MEQVKTFQAVNDDVLIDIISQVRDRLVFIAPGVRERVAKAIVDAAERILEHGTVNVILDVSAEVCRLGYGDIEGLKMVQKASGSSGFLSSQPGVRIGVLIADDDTLVYSPTPLYLEAEPEVAKEQLNFRDVDSDGQSENRKPVVKPNGILLKKSVPTNLANACAADGVYLKREIGMEPVKNEEIENAANSLAANPPKEFNVARQERVFSSQICFMELEVTDYKIASKRLELPPALFVADDETRKRLSNRFQVFDKNQLPNDVEYKRKNGRTVFLSYEYIDKRLKETRKDFLINVGKWGTVMLRSRMRDFDNAVDEIVDMLRYYRERIKERCREIALKSFDRLVEEVSGKLIENPPIIWRNRLAGARTDEEKKQAVKELLADHFESEVENAIQEFNPKTKKIERGVTYETFNDNEFINFIDKALGRGWREQYFDEHDAIPEGKPVK